MPTNRTRTKRRRGGLEGVTDAVISYFWWEGTLHAGPGYAWGLSHTSREILEFYNHHKDEILAAYIERNRERRGEPGKRPFLFWLEIDEPRRVIGKMPYFKPCGKDGPDMTQYFQDVFESDFDFLKRLGLLLGWEKEAKRPIQYYEKIADFIPADDKEKP